MAFFLLALLLTAAVIIPIPTHSLPRHTITAGQNLTDSEQLVSANGAFTLGFFSPGKSTDRYYLGIWYTEDEARRVVWVANRVTPIPKSPGGGGGVVVLLMGDDGKLKIKHGEGLSIVLNSDNHHQIEAPANATATLLDSGNLVLTHIYMNSSGGGLRREQRVWESFDYPSDTLLPGMRLEVNLKDGSNRSLTSWLSHEVPAPGAFTLGLDPTTNDLDSCRILVWRRGVVFWRSEVWRNGSSMSIKYEDWWSSFNVSFICDVVSEYEKYAHGEHYHLSGLTEEEGARWGGQQVKIKGFPEFEITLCEGSGHPILRSGCVDEEEEEEETRCGKHHRSSGFKLMKNYTDRRAEYSDGDPNLGLSDCDAKCRDNCSCIAYAPAHRNGTGCLFWLHTGPSEEGPMMNMNLRLDAFVSAQHLRNGSNHNWICYTTAIVTLQIVLCCSICCSSAESKVAPGDKIFHDEFIRELSTHESSTPERSSKRCAELQIFNFLDIKVATDNFSSKNKLGKGGFGAVYKGILSEGQEIAVKRLSRGSVQGLLEFKNEIVLISKLQHTNLVKLLGYCIDGEEKVLVYEYLPNKSLDFLIFDPIKNQMLDWQKRFSIIEGIAQGLLYLHKYSRLRVIHRDLKASNILLDNDMNPKISDFGLARMFRQDESRANTKRVVGTFGYMSPEYAMDGIVSMKSDVFSFGVILLEIISGRKNTSFYESQQHVNLIGYAWKLWKEGRILELIDSETGGTFSGDQMRRCIHVALLCVQEKPIDRPSMLNVVFMLGNETTVPLPTPKRPAFSFESSTEMEANCTLGSSEEHPSPTLSISMYK